MWRPLLTLFSYLLLLSLRCVEIDYCSKYFEIKSDKKHVLYSFYNAALFQIRFLDTI